MCNPFDPTECLVDIADEVGESIFETIAKAFAQAAGAMAQEMLTWWVDTDSSVDASLMQDMQDLLIPFAVFVGVLAVTVGGIKMVLSRKADPLLDIGTGLFLFAFWTGAGISAVVLALKLADSLSDYILEETTGGDLAQRLGTFLIVGAVADPGLILVLSIIVLIASIILWVLSFLRIASTVVLAGLTPLAAAAGMTEGFKGGLRKFVMWMVALIAFKPACAFIYGCGFLAIGKGNGIGAAMIGVTILSLAVVALPAMLSSSLHSRPGRPETERLRRSQRSSRGRSGHRRSTSLGRQHPRGVLNRQQPGSRPDGAGRPAGERRRRIELSRPRRRAEAESRTT